MNIPNIQMSAAYYAAYDHLNRELFNGKLPVPMLVLTRDARVIAGHFVSKKWTDTETGKKTIHEIAININMMQRGDPVLIFGILVHEMVHLWQEEKGEPTRNGYHNQEWVDKAQELGLECPEGPGQKANTNAALTPGGPAEIAIADMPDEAWFPWTTTGIKQEGDDKGGGTPPPPPPVTKSGKRSKYTCPVCGLNAWAKAGVVLICGACNQPLVEQVGAPPEDMDE